MSLNRKILLSHYAFYIITVLTFKVNTYFIKVKQVKEKAYI